MRILFRNKGDVAICNSWFFWCLNLICLHSKIARSYWAVWATRASAQCKLCTLLYRQGFIWIQTWPGWGFFLLYLLLCFVRKCSPSSHCFSIHNLISCVLLLVINTKGENRSELLHTGDVLAACSSALGQCPDLRRRHVEVKLF